MTKSQLIKIAKTYFSVVGWLFSVSFASFALIVIASPSHNMVIFLMLACWVAISLPPIYYRYTKKYGYRTNILSRIGAFVLSIVFAVVSGLVLTATNSGAAKTEQQKEVSSELASPNE
jgi:hypothetical protein